MTSPFSETGVIDPETCRLLVDTYEMFAPCSTIRDQHGNALVAWSDRYMSQRASMTFLTVVKQCLQLTAGAFRMEMLYPETVLLAMLRDGQGHIPHADNETRVGDAWIPNHTPQRDYAGLLYLNSAFEAGELRFRGSESLAFYPTGGLYVSFPCDRRFVHEVTPVEHGRRYSLALWYTCRHAYANVKLANALDQLSPQQGLT